MTSEFDIIKNIQTHIIERNPQLIKGIGDDAAVVKKDTHTVHVISKDLLIEDIHFELKFTSWLDLGKKAMAVNLSDIAAMAAKPAYALVALGIPSKMTSSDISELYTGLEYVANEFSVSIVGGDLSRSPDKLFISITVVGEVTNTGCKYRDGAQEGDGIYVSGPLGSAAIGFAGLKKKKIIDHAYVQAFKNPRPRIALGSLLAECSYVHAMIDTSDGLVQDLEHMMHASKMQARLVLDDIPIEKEFHETCKKLKLDPVETLLTGGEDYQLLFCMDDKKLPNLLKKLEMKRNIQINRIGSVMKPCEDSHTPTIQVFDSKQKEVKIKTKGFDHFKS
ncbi:MAG: thiamine-phosphate kinase [bacterium]|nr:thiamine-phosphate kinase [bacterium]MBU1918790.1 thiamine-phosphate kinase [bacterium]